MGEQPTQDTRISDFWDAARGHLGWGRLDAVLGTSDDDVVAPPVWSFGDDARLADELLELVLSGRKTGTSTALVEIEDEGVPVPAVGDVSIVVDSAGDPRALLRTTQVEVVPFDQVGAEHAAAEGEDDLSLESWGRGGGGGPTPGSRRTCRSSRSGSSSSTRRWGRPPRTRDRSARRRVRCVDAGLPCGHGRHDPAHDTRPGRRRR